ncbi:MAG: ATP-grasp domain-containing protein [Chloroflexi bacterium]|nr:MAG: ATP-grasp domain-containing protein [Chloroflexota bacterium]
MRVIRACHELGIRAVAVYSDVDRGALHVRLADEAYPIGPAAPRESYLAIGKLVEVARRARCDAVHPGYGFLSENADFADAVRGAGLVFVGPPGEVQRRLGDKTQARRLARDAGVPIADGTLAPLRDLAEARSESKRIGYPVMLKAAAGGGGKGMRAVASAAELDAAWRLSSGEAAGAFGSEALFVEKLIEHARHVEMQILADGSLGDAALRIARAAGYVSAGTVEFLVDERGGFSFLEVNTRLQVEHPVTELVTGLDLVALQLRIAAGEPLPFAQSDVRRRGAAIEMRVTAEDARRGFVPATGRIAVLREPAGPGVRVDSGLFDGLVVTSDYDPLLMKVIAHGVDRTEALARARRAVRETIVAGLPTSLAFHAHVLDEPDFVAGRYDTAYVAMHWPPRAPVELDDSQITAAALVAVLAARGRATRRLVASPDGAWSRAGREEALR